MQKKVLFLQIKGNSCGGVWFVNKTIGEELIAQGYDVEVLSIRDSHSGINLEYDSRLKVSIINHNDKWEITHFSDIKKELKKLKLFSSVKLTFRKFVEEYKLNKDFSRVKDYIRKEDFDYIVVSHYQLLDVVPKDYLSKTVYEHHTSFEVSYANKAIRKTFEKYKDKVKFIWLSKATCNSAIKAGYSNSTYIYNPVRFLKKEIAPVADNKKLITIARISLEKRIDLMIKIVDNIFKDSRFDDWTFEIYGDGDQKSKILHMDYNKERIKFMGLSNSPQNVLMTASINLNTSLYEGFAMVILEANECGVPTVTFDFGESVCEEIIQDNTGIYVKQDDVEAYKNKLMELMLDANKLQKMSKNCKEFSKKFQVSSIINNWIAIFNELDENN